MVNPVNLNRGEIYRECDGIWQMTISIIQFTNLWLIFRYVCEFTIRITPKQEREIPWHMDEEQVSYVIF